MIRWFLVFFDCPDCCIPSRPSFHVDMDGLRDGWVWPSSPQRGILLNVSNRLRVGTGHGTSRSSTGQSQRRTRDFRHLPLQSLQITKDDDTSASIHLSPSLPTTTTTRTTRHLLPPTPEPPPPPHSPSSNGSTSGASTASSPVTRPESTSVSAAKTYNSAIPAAPRSPAHTPLSPSRHQSLSPLRTANEDDASMYTHSHLPPTLRTISVKGESCGFGGGMVYTLGNVDVVSFSSYFYPSLLQAINAEISVAKVRQCTCPFSLFHTVPFTPFSFHYSFAPPLL
jgi:hypothetical protein